MLENTMVNYPTLYQRVSKFGMFHSCRLVFCWYIIGFNSLSIPKIFQCWKIQWLIIQHYTNEFPSLVCVILVDWYFVGILLVLIALSIPKIFQCWKIQW